jgi:hypothetical protein
MVKLYDIFSLIRAILASDLFKSLSNEGHKRASCQLIFRMWHSTLLQREQKRCNKMCVPIILEASLQRLRGVVPASLRAVDRIRHHINTSEEAVPLSRFTTKKKNNWSYSLKLMYLSEMRATAGTATLSGWPRVIYVFWEWFVVIFMCRPCDVFRTVQDDTGERLTQSSDQARV